MGPIPGSYFDQDLYDWVDANGKRLTKEQRNNAKGQVWSNDQSGSSNKTIDSGHWATPGTGGGDWLGSIGNAIGSVASPIVNPIGQSVGNVVSSAGKAVGPYVPAIIAGLATGGALGLFGDAAGAGVGAGAAGSAGDLYSTGLAASPYAGADAYGGLFNAGAAAGAAGATGPIGSEAGAAYNPAGVGSAAPSGMASAAGASGAAGAASTGAGLASTGNAITDFIGNNKGLIGAAAGALASQDSKQTSTSDKTPWAPAVPWLTANLGLGQQLQSQYMQNPLSQAQKQAYNNSNGIANQASSLYNNLMPQLNNMQGFDRNNPTAKMAPMNFGYANLGMSGNPFPGA